MKTNLKILFIITLLATVFLFTQAVFAQELQRSAQEELNRQDTAFLSESGLGSNFTISKVISRIIKVLLSFVGVIFIVLIIYAGYLWMTAAGNEESITKAKKIMTSAIIGLAIVLFAYAITYFVVDRVLEATVGGTGLD